MLIFIFPFQQRFELNLFHAIYAHLAIYNQCKAIIYHSHKMPQFFSNAYYKLFIPLISLALFPLSHFPQFF